MSNDGPAQRQSIEKMRMNGWACASVAVLLVVGMLATILFAGAVYLIVRHRHSVAPRITVSIAVRAPTFIAGPAIEMSLPAGTDLSSSSVDAEGGNWWYQDTGAPGHLQLLIAASKIGSGQPAVSDDYFQRVIRIIEHSSGDFIETMGSIQTTKILSYDGRRAGYDVTQMNGTRVHAQALLLRRESDDLLVILYGDESASQQIDRMAQQMFDSLQPRPTPQQYDVHTVLTEPATGP